MPSDVGTSEPKITISLKEHERLKSIENFMRRAWFFLVDKVPLELVDETMDRLIKRSADARLRGKEI